MLNKHPIEKKPFHFRRSMYFSEIHKTAIIHPTAQIGNGCEIGPHVYIGPEVEIGENNIIHRNVDIAGWTKIGNNNKIYSYAALGGDPQDRTYCGETTKLSIGDDNIIREFATISRGTTKGGGITLIGDHNMFMAYSHVAHDCVIGSHVTLVNSANLAGHVQAQDYCFIGGLVAIHQHVIVGRLAIIGLNASVARDVPPFTMAAGNRATLRGINIIGLRRNGYSQASINTLRKAYPILFRQRHKLSDCIERLKMMDLYKDDVIIKLTHFLSASQRGYLRHNKNSDSDQD
ncbi:acyl-ACP--UDP-N-acetylglucosamine O-acyltransferase [Acidithiobacillus sp. HP-6]|uniref:acyl-ACP--UDP-N-acetylglucosamine O-acyltransferase n=1 Tax=unclassified Acidithiobacillus TaxID=2614800 RepID=UPI001879889B|nr:MULTISPECIES: acyl-ACP--UDP-N-acetylglucosamine O-acyltransferase [unclassified Acidithiobacillus]MBE7564255.1 acyl-ACP--UDP-N-acetylglucosamine O-acyltransferase [Acidithiobacillus sp. HP-6]MBE7570894.1 acyl-ACP--UDP-N-acetylglucosamine O-acyltransferase [Acidithiobacillus sp. HP-2]